MGGVPVGHRLAGQGAGSHLGHNVMMADGSTLGVMGSSGAMMPVVSGVAGSVYGDGAHVGRMLTSREICAHGLPAGAAGGTHVGSVGVGMEVGVNGVNGVEELSADLNNLDFANENFGFDIDSLLVEK